MSTPPLDTSEISLLGYLKMVEYDPLATLVEDTFDAFDDDIWELYGNRIHLGETRWEPGTIFLVHTSARPTVFGMCEYEPGIPPATNAWQCTMTFRRLGHIDQYTDAKVGLGCYADSIDNLGGSGGYYFDFGSIPGGTTTFVFKWIRGWALIYKDGAFQSKTRITAQAPTGSVFYVRGESWIDSDRVVELHLDDIKIETLAPTERSTLTLTDAIPAFISWAQYENYIDGVVRVWDSGEEGQDSPYHGAEAGYSMDCHGDTYEDVNIRIRSDAWILAWHPRDADRGRFQWWGGNPAGCPAPPTDYTKIARAVEIICEHLGADYEQNFFPDDVGHYDYEYPDAKKIYFFGRSQGAGHEEDLDESIYYYLTVPAGVTVYRAVMGFIVRMMCDPYDAYGTIKLAGYIWDSGVGDWEEIYDYSYAYGAHYDYCYNAGGHGGNHPSTFDCTSYLSPTGVMHQIRLRRKEQHGGGGFFGYYFKHIQCIALWTS